MILSKIKSCLEKPKVDDSQVYHRIVTFSFNEFHKHMIKSGKIDIFQSIIQDSKKSELEKLDYQRVIDLFNWWEKRKDNKELLFQEDTNNLLRLISLSHVFSD